MAHPVDSPRRAPLPRDLTDAVLSAVGRATVTRLYRAGGIICYEGDPTQAAYVIECGQVRVYRTALSGREQVLAVLGEGDAFNAAPVFQQDGINRSTVQALTDASVFVLQPDELLAAVRRSPDLALALLRHFANRLDDLAGLVEDLSLRSVRGRLARFLLRSADGGAAARRWTQDEMASQLGSVRDVIGRSLRALEDEGLVRIDRHRIVLIDREGMEAAAES
jgi:CRP/FNR family cyclic AMP-dependent transcriptional regulator